jgi:hypothetical protein
MSQTTSAKVHSNLRKHASGWPRANALQQAVCSGPKAYGLAGINPAVQSEATQAMGRAPSNLSGRSQAFSSR